jgi:tryptophan synthase alpha chain
MNRIEKKFIDLRKKHKKAFIAFITAGYPNLSTTEKLIVEFDRLGVDVLELGVPFSDPMADGPIIQEASQESLKKGTQLVNIINLVKKARKSVNIPICLMSYYNPIFCFGEERFVKKAIEAGVDGVIVPDLPPEEGKSLIKFANKQKLDVICFIAPTTSKKRIRYIVGIAKGFIYYVSLTGVTGLRKSLPDDIKNNLKTIKSLTKKPVCVGFGISNRMQAEELYKFSDGVIVGSAIVKKIMENIGKPDLVKEVSSFVRSLKP